MSITSDCFINNTGITSMEDLCTNIRDYSRKIVHHVTLVRMFKETGKKKTTQKISPTKLRTS